jgi:hypothetical protein
MYHLILAGMHPAQGGQDPHFDTVSAPVGWLLLAPLAKMMQRRGSGLRRFMGDPLLTGTIHLNRSLHELRSPPRMKIQGGH